MAQKDDCIFCKIARGEIPSAKIYEDDRYMAFLDGMPNTKGQTLVITKEHYDSYVFDMPKEPYMGLFEATKKVSSLLERGLKINRIGMIIEGMGVNHIHVKLYPMHGVGEGFEENVTDEKVYFDKYPGYLTSKTGEKADMDDLQKTAEEIRNRNN